MADPTDIDLSATAFDSAHDALLGVSNPQVDRVVGLSNTLNRTKPIAAFARLISNTIRRFQRRLSGAAINAREHGAIGDGVTDDTTALQSAITAAAGSELFIPAGTYLISSALVVPSDTTIRGAGPDATILYAPTLGAAVLGTGQTSYSASTVDRRFRIRVLSLGIQGNSGGAVASSIGVDLSQCSSGLVAGCRIRFCETSVRVANVAYYNDVVGCECSNATDGVLIENGANSNAIERVRCVSVANGVVLREGANGAANNITIGRLWVETYSGRGVWMNGSTAGLLAANGVRGCRFESGTTGVEIEAGGLNCYITPDNHFASLTDLVIDAGVRTQWEAGGGFRTNALFYDDTTPAAMYYDHATTAFLLRNEADSAWVGLRSGNLTLNGGSTIRSGSGSPEGVVTAGHGSLYLRTDTAGGAGTGLYVKETASGNTGWVAK